MVKISKVPSGFYTGREASRRLGVPLTTFYHQVKTGKIEKMSPPGAGPRAEGYYSKEAIEKMAQAKELFTLLYSLEPIIFERARSEDDIRGIVDLCVGVYGIGGTPSYETRLAIWHKCPDTYYVLKQEGIVVGYVSVIWFNDVALDSLMGQRRRPTISTPAGSGVYSVTGPENMLAFITGHPIESLFISLAVRPGMSNQQQREYGFRLIKGTIEVLEDFASRGMAVKRLLGTSEKQDGIRLARKLGMRELKYPGDNLLRYELDLESSDSWLATGYRAFQAKLLDETA